MCLQKVSQSVCFRAIKNYDKEKRKWAKVKLEELTRELDKFKGIIKEYEEELKEIDNRSIELEREKKLQEAENEKYILTDKEKINITRVMELEKDIVNLKEYRKIYSKAMNTKIREQAIRVIGEYESKVSKTLRDIKKGNKEELEALEKEYEEKREALINKARETEREIRYKAVYPREKAMGYLSEEERGKASGLRVELMQSVRY